jgi:putative endonuclease
MEFLNKTQTTKSKGDAAEEAALAYLQDRGLRLLQRNYRTPGRGGGEIDLIMQLPDSTVVFGEVRKRVTRSFGAAAASVGKVKQQIIIFAARQYLIRWRRLPPARFDVMVVEAEGIEWLQAAFDDGGA